MYCREPTPYSDLAGFAQRQRVKWDSDKIEREAEINSFTLPEVGCGEGKLLDSFRKQFPDGQYEGLMSAEKDEPAVDRIVREIRERAQLAITQYNDERISGNVSSKTLNTLARAALNYRVAECALQRPQGAAR